MKNEEIEIIEEKNKFSREEKERFFESGPWCEEPDYLKFKYKDYVCEIIRVIKEEPFTKEFHMYGGFLCGYVTLDKDHLLYVKDLFFSEDVYCGKEITFSELCDDGIFRVGFDCAHSNDIVPSLEKFYKENNLSPMHKTHLKFGNYPIFNPTYKDIDFCIEECKNLVNSIEKHIKKGNENNE